MSLMLIDHDRQKANDNCPLIEVKSECMYLPNPITISRM